MASFQPFEPAVHSGVAGFTQVVVPSSTSQTIQVASSISQQQTSVLVTAVNNNAAAGAPMYAYIRMSVESSTVITATATDTPMAVQPQQTSVRLFASPNPGGAYNIAVYCTVAPTTAGAVFFSPGQGGDV